MCWAPSDIKWNYITYTYVTEKNDNSYIYVYNIYNARLC